MRYEIPCQSNCAWYSQAYTNGRESMRAELGFLDLSKDHFKRLTDTLNQLTAERERCAKLIEALKIFRDNRMHDSHVTEYARKAISEYEASRTQS